MKQKIVVAFDQEATERQKEIYEKFVRDMQDADAEVEAIGGGIKIPK